MSSPICPELFDQVVRIRVRISLVFSVGFIALDAPSDFVTNVKVGLFNYIVSLHDHVENLYIVVDYYYY